MAFFPKSGIPDTVKILPRNKENWVSSTNLVLECTVVYNLDYDVNAFPTVLFLPWQKLTDVPLKSMSSLGMKLLAEVGTQVADIGAKS